MIIRQLIFLAIVSSLIGCSKQVPEDDFFPLQKGIKWRYLVVEQTPTNRLENEFSITNLGKVLLGDKYFGMDISVRQTDQGAKYYILTAEDGLFRIGKQQINDRYPVFDEPERKILPITEDIESTDSWFVETQTYILKGSALDTEPERKDVRFEMEFEIIAINEQVAVLAGQFNNCVVVEGNASIDLYVDAKLGYQTLDIQQKEWFCPTVGMVKLVRQEPDRIGMFEGGELIYELIEVDY